MNKYYVTFWQLHTHAINGYTFDKDCVGVIFAKDYNSAREIAFELTDWNFSFMYDDLEKVGMEYYPRWLLNMNIK